MNQQPAPKVNESKPIFKLVIEDIEERAEFGKNKYGTYLQANNGRDSLVDAYQEVLDLALYIKQALEEKNNG